VYSYRDDGSLSNHGNGRAWAETARLLAPYDTQAPDGSMFGATVQIENDTIVVGTVKERQPGERVSVSAYIFTRDEEDWEPGGLLDFEQDDTADEGLFGELAMTSDTIIWGVSGPLNDETVYLYDY
jgi:FG-GAP repeat